MQYNFDTSTNTLSTRYNYDMTLLFQEGSILIENHEPSSSNYESSKMELDYFASNKSHEYDNQGLGYFYGYSYYLDNELYFNFNDNCSYFALALRDNANNVILDSYYYENFSGGAFYGRSYNNQLLSPIDGNFIISSGDNTNNSYFYDSFYDIIVSPTDTNPNSFSLLFDYRLSSHKDTYYIRGEDYDFYLGYFVLGCNDSTTFQLTSGYDSSLQAEYDRGFGNGVASGRVSGFDEGYERGKQDGIAIGKLESGDLSQPIGLVGSAIEQFTPIFGIEVLPNISLGTIISIPIICSILVIIFKIAKG